MIQNPPPSAENNNNDIPVVLALPPVPPANAPAEEFTQRNREWRRTEAAALQSFLHGMIQEHQMDEIECIRRQVQDKAVSHRNAAGYPPTTMDQIQVALEQIRKLDALLALHVMQ
jgi:hypothetical protein